MIYGIVPLAGPDFFNEKYGIKPLFSFEGKPLIQAAIESRHWYQTGELIPKNLIFVLRDIPQSRKVVSFLRDIFQGCRVVLVDHLTRGAVLSSMAGLSLISDYDSPIVVDLVDILYNVTLNVGDFFAADKTLGGIIPCFNSVNPKYSYLQTSQGRVVRTAEKKVISNLASAGSYFFKNLETLLGAYRHSILHEQSLAVNGNLFLCPTFNGVVDQEKWVMPLEVSDVREISLLFH